MQKNVKKKALRRAHYPPLPPDSKEGEDATKEPSPQAPSAGKGGDTSKEPSPPPTSVLEGGDTAKEPTSPLSSGSGAGEFTNGPARPPRTWEETLHNCLALHREQRAEAGDGLKYHEIEFVSGMTIDDVLFALATTWEPLREVGTGFAFAGMDVIDLGLSADVTLKTVDLRLDIERGHLLTDV